MKTNAQKPLQGDSDMERALKYAQEIIQGRFLDAKAKLVARALISCREPVEIAIRNSFTNLAGRKCWKCPSCMTVSVWVGSKFCSDCGKEIKWTN